MIEERNVIRTVKTIITLHPDGGVVNTLELKKKLQLILEENQNRKIKLILAPTEERWQMPIILEGPNITNLFEGFEEISFFGDWIVNVTNLNGWFKDCLNLMLVGDFNVSNVKVGYRMIKNNCNIFEGYTGLSWDGLTHSISEIII